MDPRPGFTANPVQWSNVDEPRRTGTLNVIYLFFLAIRSRTAEIAVRKDVYAD
jgi:hypothetical protein